MARRQTRRSRPSRGREHAVLLVVRPDDDVAALLRLAAGLAAGRQVVLMGVVVVPAGQALSGAAAEVQDVRTRLRRLAADSNARLLPRIIASAEPGREVAEAARRLHADLVVIAAAGPNVGSADGLAAAAWEGVPGPAACVFGVLAPDVRRVAVLLGADKASEVALRLGLGLARAVDLDLVVLQSRTEGGPPSEADALQQILDQMPGVRRSAWSPDQAGPPTLPDGSPPRLVITGIRAGFAPPDWITPGGPAVVLVRGPRTPRRARASEIPGLETISVLVDKWFAENTFTASEFERLERLAKRKQDQGLTISVALPALNEEATVAKVIRTLQRGLMRRVPLVDEMVLVDSNSHDRTREIARSLGVPVFIHQEILPEHGAREGKGEALWKSLYIARGDLIFWIDTDIVNIHPRFLYGLIGPMLFRPDIVLVKGFYQRPIRVGGRLQAGGGGRVTELTARPLLNLFFPSLSGLVQPLSGEYGGRRSALEQLPFSSGYGVEIGLLIDVLERFGLSALAQVDLIGRIHHNQSLSALSRMSFAIIQAVIRKIDRRYGVQLLQDVNRSMKVIRAEGSRYFLEVEEIAERERPPMASLPEYRARFSRPVPP
jgi:glucosyl-3-phosphoglycerate synthase